jgi:hypothetical protein
MIVRLEETMGNLSSTTAQRKLRSQIAGLWTDAATVVRAVREEKESEETKPAEGRARYPKRSKSREALCFSNFCGSGRPTEAAGAESSGGMR